jgi:hypothetical protein
MGQNRRPGDLLLKAQKSGALKVALNGVEEVAEMQPFNIRTLNLPLFVPGKKSRCRPLSSARHVIPLTG